MTRRNIPRFRFCIQRSQAKRRGIEWQLTFEDWFAIWTESGHWEERGKRAGCYCMARHGDTGPYAVGNVSIITVEQNSSEGNRVADLPLGVSRIGKFRFRANRRVNGRKTYLGSFATPEEAHAAYLRAA
jgi:hypothetical protein